MIAVNIGVHYGENGRNGVLSNLVPLVQLFQEYSATHGTVCLSLWIFFRVYV